MAEFLGDLAFMFEIFVLGIGLVVLYFAKKEGSKLLKASGWIMSVAAVFGLICTSYFYFKYYFAGEFNSAHPQHYMMNQSSMKNMMNRGMMGMMGKGMMPHGRGMMNGNFMMGKMHDCMGAMDGQTMNSEKIEEMQSCIMQDTDNK